MESRLGTVLSTVEKGEVIEAGFYLFIFWSVRRDRNTEKRKQQVVHNLTNQSKGSGEFLHVFHRRFLMTLRRGSWQPCWRWENEPLRGCPESLNADEQRSSYYLLRSTLYQHHPRAFTFTLSSLSPRRQVLLPEMEEFTQRGPHTSKRKGPDCS